MGLRGPGGWLTSHEWSFNPFTSRPWPLEDLWQDTWWPRLCPDTTRRRGGEEDNFWPKIRPHCFFWKMWVSYTFFLVIFFGKMFGTLKNHVFSLWVFLRILFSAGWTKKVHPWKAAECVLLARWLSQDWLKVYCSWDFFGLSKKILQLCRVPKGGVFKGGGNWGTLRIPFGKIGEP